GSVVLEEPLWGHPRYRGLVEKELAGHDIIDTRSNMYRESVDCQAIPQFYHSIDFSCQQLQTLNNNFFYILFLFRKFAFTNLLKKKYIHMKDNNRNMPHYNYNGNANMQQDNDAVEHAGLLEEGEIVPFSGNDLLSLRVVLEQGDLVEFDVYENKKDQTIGATNVVFLDANPKSREYGTITKVYCNAVVSHSRHFRNRQSDSGKHGRIKRLNIKDEIYFHERDLLDRDQPPNEGDDVEFVVKYDQTHDRCYASRITYLPSQFLERVVAKTVIVK
ncbi:hypothetical protein RFI_02683, partial [Reticulomyxa filosa]